MEKLNFPEFSFRIRETSEGYLIFDIIRKKFVALTPEEWVRQHVLNLFTRELNYPPSLISVEKKVKDSGRTMRYDIVVYNREHIPSMIVECKAPGIALTDTTIEQVSCYNIFSKAGRVYITNGIQHYIYNVDFDNKTYRFEKEFPDFGSL